MLDRRNFLHAAGALALGAPLLAGSAPRARACIYLFLVGGPSQLDTFDPKPDAPSDVRGPYGVIRTRVPGVVLSENFPKLAGILDRVAVVRTLHHDAAPIHETGHQLMQCGKLHERDTEQPHFGAVLSHLSGSPWAVLGGPIGNTGMSISHGQTAGYLGSSHAPTMLANAGDLNQACQQARRLVEAGTRFVTINMFTHVLDCVTWDCHADDSMLPATLADYGATLCPLLDEAYSNLILDLETRGLLDTTLVVAAGEFGRTPRLNLRGGRDHWPGAWSVLLAGGGVQGGQVVGRTDAHAAVPVDRPVTPGQFAATVYRSLGVAPDTTIPGPDGTPVRIMTEEPVAELFGG